MSLTEQQTNLIKATVPVVQEHGNTITTVFYKNLLHDNPSLNDVFNQGNQLNGHQAKALAASLYGYAANIDNLEALLPAVEKIAQKHVSLYVNAEQYTTVGKYLLAAMGEVLGDALTPDILDAWSAAYTQLANLFINKEKSMQDEWPEWQDWRQFKIAKKQQESDVITSFHLKPVDGKQLPKFKPGQYISIRTDVPALNFKQPRQYSLSDSWNPDYYRITVRRDEGLNVNDPKAAAHPGYVSNVLHDHKREGDIVELSHPAGEFFLDIESDKTPFPVVLISAGVGLTPDLAMLKTILAAKDRRKVTWIHGTRNSRISAFVPEISAIAKEHSNIRSIVFYSTPLPSDVEGRQYTHKGRIDLSKLQQSEDLLLNDMKTRYFICGPSKFMDQVAEYLTNGGVDSSRIKMEVFDTGMGPQVKSNKL